MRVLVLHILLAGVAMLTYNCKPLREGRSVEPVSEPDMAMSDNGTIVTAVNGKHRGFCMIQSSSQNPDQNVKLLTGDGSISDKQLQKALKFMSYGEHIATSIIAVLSPIVAGASMISSAFKVADAADPKELKKIMKMPVAVSIVALAGTVAGTFGYRIIKGNVEGEKAGPIAVHSMLSLPVESFVVEHVHRNERVEKVISEREEIHFTNRKMEKLIDNLSDINPDFIGGCDHIKAELQG